LVVEFPNLGRDALLACQNKLHFYHVKKALCVKYGVLSGEEGVQVIFSLSTDQHPKLCCLCLTQDNRFYRLSPNPTPRRYNVVVGFQFSKWGFSDWHSAFCLKNP